MTLYVALLYSIILSPGRRVVMADLKAIAEELGLAEPRTVAATGNLVFAAKERAVPELERDLESAFIRRFGRHVDIIARSGADWLRLIAGNPFPEQSARDAGHVIVRVNRRPARDGLVETLTPYLANGEQVRSVGGDLWVHFARDIGHSRLAAAMTPKRIGIGTSRNWNTVRRLGEIVQG